MQISISLEGDTLKKFLRQYPQEMNASTKLFVDRVGYKLDAESKRNAPAVTGNLRRMIIYRNGELIAHAGYSAYVHGQPFYKNKMRRRETPFVTDAIRSSDSFIKSEARAMMRRVLE